MEGRRLGECHQSLNKRKKEMERFSTSMGVYDICTIRTGRWVIIIVTKVLACVQGFCRIGGHVWKLWRGSFCGNLLDV